MKSPYTLPPLIGKLCDCYVDEMRMAHPQKDLNKLNDNENKKMGERLIRVCNVKSEIQNI